MHAERIANSLFRRPRKSLAGTTPLLRHPRKSLAGIQTRETSSGLTLHLSSCPLSKNPPSSLFVKGGTSLRSATDTFHLTPDIPHGISRRIPDICHPEGNEGSR